jgi:hypothetical protein
MTTDCQAAAADYRTRLGWSVYALGSAVWITPGTPVEAFNVPRQVGARALACLRARAATLPVINIPGPPDRWALLTRPHDGPRDEILNLLTGRDVGYAYIGHHSGKPGEWGIDLPPTCHPGHEPLSWRTPAETPLPAAITVAHALVNPTG